MTLSRAARVVVPLASHWHVIQEIDVARLVADHRQLGDLCDLLERCADDLPTLPSAAVVIQVCDALTALAEPPAEAAGAPYPGLARLYDPDDPLGEALMQDVALRHLDDAAHARDLIDALRPGPDMLPYVSPETLGYMLRCFFTACRQAMDCEELAILALARHRLTQAARVVLLDSLRHRAGRRRCAMP